MVVHSVQCMLSIKTNTTGKVFDMNLLRHSDRKWEQILSGIGNWKQELCSKLWCSGVCFFVTGHQICASFQLCIPDDFVQGLQSDTRFGGLRLKWALKNGYGLQVLHQNPDLNHGPSYWTQCPLMCLWSSVRFTLSSTEVKRRAMYIWNTTNAAFCKLEFQIVICEEWTGPN